ncbi:hypothetical protein Lepto7375DRAFT_8323 [Leptolyngbya sp. PCC 7375]|nr:hypothetical protein Lepto7375DRAFT_8323 [Leptolyngbya sp. PCC 7375]
MTNELNYGGTPEELVDVVYLTTVRKLNLRDQLSP